MISAQYRDDRHMSVDATIDGVVWTIPAVTSDTPIARAVRDWVAAGNTIAPYVPPPPTASEVNAERDRRIARFPYLGRVYDFDAASQSNVQGAFSVATAAVMAGAQPGNLRWADPDYDFSWITAANEIVPMDAHQVVAFGKAAATWKSAHIFRARALKDMRPIPSTFKADDHWPSG